MHASGIFTRFMTPISISFETLYPSSSLFADGDTIVFAKLLGKAFGWAYSGAQN